MTAEQQVILLTRENDRRGALIARAIYWRQVKEPGWGDERTRHDAERDLVHAIDDYTRETLSLQERRKL